MEHKLHLQFGFMLFMVKKIDLIKYLEKIRIKPEDRTFEKCHHYKITDYIKSNLSN